MRAASIAAALCVATATAGAADRAAWAEPARYTIDPGHLSIVFSAHHVEFASVFGMFLVAEGSFVYDEETQTLSEAKMTIDSASVFTNHDQRDTHLRSKDFLSAETAPEISFVMTSAEAASATEGKVTGDLTLRGETRPITLDVTLNKAGVNPFGGKYQLGVSVRGVVKRSDWGMTYAAANGAVGDEVPVIIEFEAIRDE